MKVILSSAFLFFICISSFSQQIDERKLVGTWISVETKWVESNYTFNNNSEWTFTLAKNLITKTTVEGIGVLENWFDYKIVSNELITINNEGGENYSTIVELTSTKLVTRFVDKSGGDEVVLKTFRKKI